MDITEIKFSQIEFPTGWHLKKEYMDEMGNEYALGRVIRLYDGTKVEPPVLISKQRELERKTEAEKIRSEDHTKDDTTTIAQMMAHIRELERKVNQRVPTDSGLQTKDLALEIARANKMMDNEPVYDYHIEPDDYLEVPVMFVSYGIGYSIWDDKRKNQRMKIPGNQPAIFKFAASQIDKSGPRESYSSYCSYSESSKMRVEWLRNHSKYGSQFFENSNIAMKSDQYTAQAALKVSQSVSGYTVPILMKECQKHGIELGSDPSKLKAMLSQKLLGDLLKIKKHERSEGLIGQLEKNVFKD